MDSEDRNRGATTFLGLFSIPLFLFQVLCLLVEMILKKTAYVICFKRFRKIDFNCIAIKIA